MVLTDTEVREPRSRLLDGMAHAVASKGFAETTIADIVREAGVSRRTFYEQFSSKSECFVALYEAASRNALKVLREAIEPTHGWQTQVEQAMAAYLGCMASGPVLIRTLFMEILNLGHEGLQARRRVNREIAEFIVAVVNGNGTSTATAPTLSPAQSAALSPVMAMAIVGGIHELVLDYIEQDKVSQLADLVAPASQLVRAVTHTETVGGA